MLSRFVPPKEQAAALAGLEDGSVDLVIGTHRLLSKDVKFRDLGLVVVDEEQRFGVAAKERLKQLRTEVDVLTLSATPIPRTLNLALAGVRDMSRHRDAAGGSPADPDARRGGVGRPGPRRDPARARPRRPGVLRPQPGRDDRGAGRPAAPDAAGRRASSSGTGRWAEGELEKVMLAFASGEADVLVCTTIIESGLDIPNANTIIIDRADTLGLAQLYQLRGRVGRSLAPGLRLPALPPPRAAHRTRRASGSRRSSTHRSSGAGFQIALSDLEIRGAGNILGAEQSGHMAAVGFDLYTRLLAEAVEEQKATTSIGRPSIEKPSAVIDLPVDAYLPDTYVPEEPQKLELYRRLARARTAGDIAAFRQEVIDRFGQMPAPVLRLVEVARLRLAAEAAGIASISREEGQLVVRFGDAAAIGGDAALWPASGCPACRPARSVRVEPGAHPAAARSLASPGP